MEPTRFWVECPNCSDPKGSYSTAMIHAGRSCNCGTNFRINLEPKETEVIETDGGNQHRKGHR